MLKFPASFSRRLLDSALSLANRVRERGAQGCGTLKKLAIIKPKFAHGQVCLSDEIGPREAAIGWLLAEPAIAMPLAQLIAAAAKRGLVSATSLTHLMLIRNWLTEDRRRAVDGIIKAARSIGRAPEKRPATQVRELPMSERDGAGVQTIFASIKEGRKQALVSILIKQGHGVRDAWVARSLSRSEVEDMLGHEDRRAISGGDMRARLTVAG